MVRVGIAGLGFMGVTHYKAYERIRGARVEAVAEKDPKRLQGDWRSVGGNLPTPIGGIEDLSGIRRYSDLDDLFADPDLDMIDICLPSHMHAEAAIKALRAGKHVFVEKPIALTVEDADRMVKVAKEQKRYLMVGQVLRFFPEFAIIKRMQDEGNYGKIRGAFFKRVITRPTWSDWFSDPQKSGGAVVDLHIHDSDFIQYLFGMPKAVFSRGLIGEKGDVEYIFTQYIFDDTDLCVSAESGMIAASGLAFEHGYAVYFERATVRFDSLWGNPPLLFTHDGKKKQVRVPQRDAFVDELTYAVNCIRKGVEPTVISGEAARNSLLICLKEKQSVLTGKPVRISA
ncbi:MAG: Gfo/Idh/MocA family oxidoreductase [Armatimonadota bacterium]|nr:Gfo/Idh/MocA family oxidoreductase [Armatimonadota bacterium]MCX7777627.1 Gfo/Idh/MocA family oxidoreductase [Armatimonadota bacterium]MDW8024694.1 Gfo/Idh/MocA family oxidoreductase [Armatimonadota bacterium]